MKIFLILFVFSINFFGCSEKQVNHDFKIISYPNSNDGNLDANKNTSNSEFNNVKIDGYLDNDLSNTYFYNQGLLTESISYNTQTKKTESVTKYYYKENGEYERLERVVGQNSDLEAFDNKLMQDLKVQYEFIESKSINLPQNKELLFNEIHDMSSIFSIADNYNDFEKFIENNENKKIIKFIGFNKNIRFYPSDTTMLIPENTIIRDYQLTLINNRPSKEIFKIDNGKLTREYFYDNKRIAKVLYNFVGEDKNNSLEKRFDYHALD